MLTEIRLDKFQGFGEKQTVPLRPLTLIYGPNASGKSSLLRAVRLLHQSISTEWPFVRRNTFLFEGEQISLASFANVVHKHDTDSHIALGFKISLPSRPKRSRMSQALNLIDAIDVEWTLRDPGEISSVKLRYSVSNLNRPNGQTLLAGSEVAFEFVYEDETLKLSSYSGDEALSYIALNHADSDEFSSSFLGENDIIRGYESNFDLSWDALLGTSDYFLRGVFPAVMRAKPAGGEAALGNVSGQEGLLSMLLSLPAATLASSANRTHYVGPLREIEKRLTFQQGLRGEEGGLDNRTSTKLVNEKISEWLSKLTGGRYTFEPVEFIAGPVEFLGGLKSQIVFDNLTGTMVTFEDVGVGLSQVMPILRALHSISVRKNPDTTDLVLIEQPELHLHPKMQADLAQLFTDVLRERPGAQIIAETHSEAFLLRLQRLLRSGELRPEDIQILFVDEAAGSNRVFPLRLDPSNDFELEMPLSFSGLRLSEYL